MKDTDCDWLDVRTFELPAHLHSTRDLLDGSLKLHPHESAPVAPMSLVDDLSQRFTPPVAVAAARRESWLQRAAAFVARPAFGVAAVAAVVLAVAGPAILDRNSAAPAETFRGGPAVTAADHSPRIILIGGTSEILGELQTSGLFEQRSIIAATTAETSENPRIVVNFETGKLTVFNAAGEEVHFADAPTDADALGSAIASALGHL